MSGTSENGSSFTNDYEPIQSKLEAGQLYIDHKHLQLFANLSYRDDWKYLSGELLEYTIRHAIEMRSFLNVWQCNVGREGVTQGRMVQAYSAAAKTACEVLLQHLRRGSPEDADSLIDRVTRVGIRPDSLYLRNKAPMSFSLHDRYAPDNVKVERNLKYMTEAAKQIASELRNRLSY